MIRSDFSFVLAPYLLLIFVLSAQTHLGQTDFNFSIEAGTLHDRNHLKYESQSISGSGFSRYDAIRLGIERGGLIFKTGFVRYQHSVRVFTLDDGSNELSKIPRHAVQDDVESFVIPISVSKEIRLGERWDMEVGLGLLLIAARYPDDEVTFVTFSSRDSSGIQVDNPDSTRIDWGAKRNFNAGFETFLQFEYKTRSPFSFYASMAFQAHFAPVFEADYTFYREGDEFSKGVALGLNSFSFGLGLRYTLLRKPNQKSTD